MQINQISLYQNYAYKNIQNTSNPISFKSSDFEISCKNLTRDLINYIDTNPYFNERELDKIYKKYCPKSTFKKAKRIEAKNSSTIDYTGTTEKEYTFKKDLFGKRKATLAKQEISVVFPISNSPKEKTLFLGRLIHEGVHALQTESTDKTTELDTINEFLKKESKPRLIKKNIIGASILYEELCTQLMDFINEGAQKYSPDYYASSNEICLRCYQTKTAELATKILNKILNNLDKEIDKNFALKYCSQIAKSEIEAYTKEMEFMKTRKYHSETRFIKSQIEANQAIFYALNLAQKKPF